MEQFKSYFDTNAAEERRPKSFNIYLSRIFLWLASWFMLLLGSASLMLHFRLFNYVAHDSVFQLIYGGIYLSFSFFVNTQISKMKTEIAALLFAAYGILDGVIFSFFAAFIDFTPIRIALLSCAAICLLVALYTRILDSEISGFELFLMILIFGNIICGILYYFMGKTSFDFKFPSILILILTGTASTDIALIREVYGEYKDSPYSENAAISSAFKISIDLLYIIIVLAQFLFKDRRYYPDGRDDDDDDSFF